MCMNWCLWSSGVGTKTVPAPKTISGKNDVTDFIRSELACLGHPQLSDEPEPDQPSRRQPSRRRRRGSHSPGRHRVG